MNNREENYIYFLTILGAFVGIVALGLGLENLEENREQNKGQQRLLEYLEEHLKNQDEHLKAQDKLLRGGNNGEN